MSLSKVFSRYSLTHAPFDKDIAVEDFFSTDELDAARQRVLAALGARSTVCISGDSGTGKTYLGRSVEESLPKGSYDVHYLHNATLAQRDFYRQLSMALGLNPRASAAALFHQVSNYFIETATEKKVRPVIILDEAQLLPMPVLTHLPILLNFQMDSKPWLSVVLVGLPELRSILNREILKPLAARIPTRIHLQALDPAGVRAYVSHRMQRAGARHEVFSEDALMLMAEATGGVMRKINILATQTLIEGTTGKGTVIDAQAVIRAIELVGEALR